MYQKKIVSLCGGLRESDWMWNVGVYTMRMREEILS